jgi:hypothetical protein
MFIIYLWKFDISQYLISNTELHISMSNFVQLRGNKLAAVFATVVIFLNQERNVFYPVLNVDSKMELAIFVPFLAYKLLQEKNNFSTFVRFSDFHFTIPPVDHSFLRSLHLDIDTFIFLPFSSPSDIWI